jgi:hypothetical protein
MKQAVAKSFFMNNLREKMSNCEKWTTNQSSVQSYNIICRFGTDLSILSHGAMALTVMHGVVINCGLEKHFHLIWNYS